MHSAAEGYGGGGDDQLLQLHHHHHHHHHHQDSMMYHVPQHSRREKLRFPPEDSLPLLLHDPNTSPPPLYHPSTLTTTFLPASSASACCYYAQNPNQFSPLHLPIPHHQPFSLSLSPSSSTPPQPPRHHVSTDAGAPRNTGPLGPFTGYAAVLNRSGFLQPARLLLEEMCHVVRGAAAGGGDASHPSDPLSAAHHSMEEGLDRPIPGVEQHQWKKIGLISLLDEVCKRYRQYYQQVQAVITSFESVAGLSTAAPYAFMALKVMRKHFKCLKSAISDQLHHTDKEYQNEGLGKEENSGFVVDHSGVYLQKAANNSGSLGQPHAWRPQRGLPERAVAVLRAWLFEHFLHPYPSDAEKQMLAKQTGLSRNQVSNWFINARVRLWKPMVEEIHSLEMRELHNVAVDDRNHTTSKQAQPPSASTATPSNNQPTPKTSIQKNQNPSSKRFRDELTQLPNPIEQPFSLVYDDLSSHHRVGGGGGGVSLTLGLQNNGVRLPEPIPLNLVRRFGFEECSDAYVVGAFEGSDRLFGKDIGGHFLHDFAG